MPLDADTDPLLVAEQWLVGFNAAIGLGGADALAECFRNDGHWRDVVGLSWDFNTISGHGAIGERLASVNAIVKARNFAIDGERLAPRILERAGTQVVEAILSFETAVGMGEGFVRIQLDDAGGDAPLAWTLMTALDQIRGHEEWTVQETREEPAFLRNFHGPNWIEKRDAVAVYIDHDPAVLVVGGGPIYFPYDPFQSGAPP